jgi:hypothetical protein
VDEVALEEVYCQVLVFSPVGIKAQCSVHIHSSTIDVV